MLPTMLVNFAGCSRNVETTGTEAPREYAEGKVVVDSMAAPAFRDGAVAASAMSAPLDGLAVPTDLGQGPGMGGDKYDVIDDNPFLLATQAPLSTFSIDVDTASYSKIRSYLLGQRQLPRKDAVRIEELINYFDYSYRAPQDGDPHPIIADVGLTDCPWNTDHRLARVAIKGIDPHQNQRPSSNLVFLIDVSGSMNQDNKLPLLKKSLTMLTRQMSESDRISIVVYAGSAGVVLDGGSGEQPELIVEALDRLQAGGSTNGGAGIMQAYELARDHFVEGGDNRVILCSDGDFNVGTTGTDSLVRLVEQQASGGIYLTILGFGMGNHNDSMMEQISGRGNGNYFFIDTEREAQKVLVQDIHGTLTTIAKDVKIQVEFNPSMVAAYRLIGYENRVLQAEDFNDDAKDAGEVGAGHRVTALYEIVPRGTELPNGISDVDPLRYQTVEATEHQANEGEWMVVKVRYKRPAEAESEKFEFVVSNAPVPFDMVDSDLRFAAAVASFGMLLRESPHRGQSSFDDVLEMAQAARGEDPFGFRSEFCDLVRVAKDLKAM
jgi:Ca-activated chloride channel family protein